MALVQSGDRHHPSEFFPEAAKFWGTLSKYAEPNEREDFFRNAAKSLLIHAAHWQKEFREELERICLPAKRRGGARTYRLCYGGNYIWITVRRLTGAQFDQIEYEGRCKTLKPPDLQKKESKPWNPNGPRLRDLMR